MNENASVLITLTGTDSDPTDVLTFAYTNPSSGALSGSAPYLTYAPLPHQHAADGFSYTVFNGTNTSAPAIVSITVTDYSTPIAYGQSGLTTNENTPLTVALTATDTDGNALTCAVATAPAHGSVTISGSLATYRPNLFYYGPDTFSFTASDGTNVSAPAQVALTVLGALPTVMAVTPASGPLSGIAVTISGSNFVAGCTVTFGGVLALNVDLVNPMEITCTAPAGSAGTVAVTVTNPGGQHASSSFTYVPSPQVQTITLSSGSVAGSYQIVLAGTGFQSGATIAITMNTSALPGSNVAVNTVMGSITYSVPAGAAGIATVVVTNPDGQTGTSSYTLNAPTAQNQSYSDIYHDNSMSYTLAVPVDRGVLAGATPSTLNGSLSAAVISAPVNGALTLKSDGSFTYVPKSGFTGADTFTYTCSDSGFTSVLAQAVITVVPRDTVAINSLLPVSPAAVLAGAMLNFSAHAVASGGAVTWVWNFGDGATAGGAGATVAGSHAYASSGMYTATLTVTSDDGWQAQAEITVVVSLNTESNGGGALPPKVTPFGTPITAGNGKASLSWNSSSPAGTTLSCQIEGLELPAGVGTVALTQSALIGGTLQFLNADLSNGPVYNFTLNSKTGKSTTATPGLSSLSLTVKKGTTTGTVNLKIAGDSSFASYVQQAFGTNYISTPLPKKTKYQPFNIGIPMILSITTTATAATGAHLDLAADFIVTCKQSSPARITGSGYK